MTASFVPVNEPLLEGNELAYLTECVKTGWISSEGPFVSRFEEELSAYVGRAHGVAVANGSVALDLAFAALQLEAGSEVILPTFTIISCAASIVRAGLRPVLVDCDPRTWNMTAADVEAKITPKTRAILVVHVYGLPVDMDPILALAAKHGLQIIEDAAEMHGQTYNGRRCGSFGALSIFSFYPNKVITTGEGGMVVTDDPALAERCRLLRNLAFVPGRRFVHEELGWNFRMTNLQAALGVAQLERIDTFLPIKRAIGRRYNEGLRGVAGITTGVERTGYAESLYWVYGLVLDDAVPFDAAHAIDWLGRNGVGSRPFFWCMHEQPVFRQMHLFDGESYPHAERLARRGLYIPSGMAITAEQQERVIDKVKEMLR